MYLAVANGDYSELCEKLHFYDCQFTCICDVKRINREADL